MKRILAILFISTICCSIANADPFQNCLNKIEKHEEIWQKVLDEQILNTLPENPDVYDFKLKQEAIYRLLAMDILLACPTDVAYIAKSNHKAIIHVKFKNKPIDFKVSKKITEYIDTSLGILVINEPNLLPGEVLELKNIKTNSVNKHPFPSECSDWHIAGNLDDNAPVNLAGQSVFGEYGGSKNEFFLDFADNDRRAFPGLVIMEKTRSASESIVSYRSIPVGISKTQQFAQNLQGTQCSGKGLAVYLVALDVVKGSKEIDTSSVAPGPSSSTDWFITAGVWGGASALFSSTATALATGVLTSASFAAAVPVAGWVYAAVVAGAVAIGATVMALVPQELKDIQQVMIIDGPYRL